MPRKPLSGIRVLDLSQGIAGPSCAGILRQSGASVIKVEPPSGDWSRLMGGGRDGQTALSVAGNVGKRAVCIDATAPEGRDVVLRLARDADVVIESFRPGVVERLGLDYAAVRNENPVVIYLSITGFGRDGPYAEKPGTDSILQALTGMMVMNQDERGTPRRVGMLVIDASAAVYSAQSVGAALYSRTVDGAGRHIQISLMEVSAALQAIPIVDHALHVGEAKPPVTVPSGTFATADGLLNIVALRNEMFFSLCRALDRSDWLEDPRFASNASRLRHATEIHAGISDALSRKCSAHWIDLFDRHDVLCAPVKDYSAFLADDQAQHLGIFGQLAQPQFGTVPFPRLPGTGDDAADTLPPSPRLGQDTVEVLAEAGYSSDQIAALSSAGVIRQG